MLAELNSIAVCFHHFVSFITFYESKIQYVIYNNFLVLLRNF